jgi:hypothetical protein
LQLQLAGEHCSKAREGSTMDAEGRMGKGKIRRRARKRTLQGVIEEQELYGVKIGRVSSEEGAWKNSSPERTRTCWSARRERRK